jgi:U32 family peptidase
MELLSPAGNIEKLTYAYEYGADAAYIGLNRYSLRAKADNFAPEDAARTAAVKGGKKLYGALNIYFHPGDLRHIEGSLDLLRPFPFDAFIVSDIGLVPLLRREFPEVRLHLSTQANCVNAEAAKLYRDMGFSRIILGRELTLAEIEEIRKGVGDDLELECFVHGAMCLAYSGRCFLSAYMAGRSGNKGDCAHACRWNYRPLVIEEMERPGEYYPLIEAEGFTTLLSSKDLCMIDHLREMRDAGIDSVKIEGRMKSIYYTAVVTRAYRKMIDAEVFGLDVPGLEEYRGELFSVSHREYSTGFYFGREDIAVPTESSYHREYILLGSLGKRAKDGSFSLDVRNSIRTGENIEYIGPDVVGIEDSSFRLYDAEGSRVEAAHHGKPFFLETEAPVQPGYILRRRM